MFDLLLLPIKIANGQEQSDLAGYLAENAPRRAARGRSEDQLIVFLGQRGSLIPPDPDLEQALERCAEAYFKTPGPVTAAMRLAAETLSKDLLARSRRAASPTSQSGYLLNFAVVHGTVLFLAHCGPTHSYFIGQAERAHFHDAAQDARAFGLGQGAALRFFQVELHSGDSLLLAPEAPGGLATLTSDDLEKITADQLHQGLLAFRPAALGAALIEFQAGSGKIETRTAAASVPAPSTPPPGNGRVSVKPSEVPAYVEIQTEEDAALPESPVKPEVLDRPEPTATADRPSTPPVTPAQPRPVPSRSQSDWLADLRRPERAAASEPQASQVPQIHLQEESEPAQAEKSTNREPLTVPVLRALSRLLHGGERVQGASRQALSSFFSRLLPGQSDQPYSLSPLTMVFVAIAVPLVIVTLALAVYFERGRGKMFQTYFAQAVDSAALTQTTTDPAILRSAWSEALYWLDKAEANQTTADSQALRGQAQQALDQLDSIARLDFQSAISGELASGVNVTEIIASSNDLYLLNGAQGRVLRAELTGRGFEVDPEFRCEPGPSGSYVIGELVDIAPMPKGNEFHASIMAIDGSGNLIFCGPGITPTSIPLAPPDTNWGKIQAITFASNGLYVLDPVNNAVWVYDGIGAFRDRPRMFFGNQVPPLSSAVDLASNGDDLFLLHADGHLTLCATTYGSTADPKCTDPAPVTDPRPGRGKNVTTLPDTQFTEIQYTQPPDPSLYMLNPADGSIYHFSLRLNLQRQMRAFAGTANPFPAQPATAFAVAPNRMVFIAFGSRVFYGIAP